MNLIHFSSFVRGTSSQLSEASALLLCLSLIVPPLLGCSGREEASTTTSSAETETEGQPETEPGTDPGTEPGTEPEAEPEAEEAAPEALAEAPVRALVEAWRSAQNEGNFEAYQALYAERFTGIKRSGERTRIYNHASWLADRRGMFRRPMQVEVEDLRVHASSAEATVTFTQRWSSPTFRDVGPKRLRIVRQGEGLRIAQEEMLSSEILDHPGAAAGSAAGFHPFVALGGIHGVVLREEAEEGWSAGRLRLLQREDVVSVAQAARASALPEAVRALAGSALVVYGPSGEVCRGEVGPMHVLRRIIPHFGTVQNWNGEEGGPAFSRAQVAADAWAAHGPGGVLMAELRSEGSCRGGLFALPAAASAPTFYALREARAPEQAALLSATRAGATYRHLQQDYEGSGPWDEHEPQRTRSFRIGEAGSRRFALVDLAAGNACGEFGEHLLTLLAPQGEGWSAAGDLGRAQALALFDLEGDGRPEVMIREDFGSIRLLRQEGARFVGAATLPLANLDCGC